MNRYWFILIVNIVNAQTPWNDNSWQLYEQDSFEVSPGSTGSKFHIETGSHGTYDENPNQNTLEPQVYKNNTNNVYVSNGKLYLQVLNNQNETLTVNGVSRTFSYTSGEVYSNNSYKFGYVEIRCLDPHGNGFWPAFWLQGGWDGDCTYSELDIFENEGHLDYYTSHNVADYSIANPCNSSNKKHWHDPGSINPTYSVNSTNVYTSSNYHVWGCEWSPNVAIFYLDNVETGRTELSSDATIDKDAIPVILNLALNTNSQHYDSRLLFPLVDNTTVFPNAFVVDYCRIYKLKMTHCSTQNETLISSSDFTGYTPEVKNNITVGNGSTSVTAQSIVLRASNEITLTGNVEVPLGIEFTAMITPCY